VNESDSAPEYDARVLKARLSTSLSTKVAMLTVALVMGVPMFQIGRYPESDFSLEGWAHMLELSYETSFHEVKRGSTNPVARDLFNETVRDMVLFYDHLQYFPIQMKGFPEYAKLGDTVLHIPGESQVDLPMPARMENVRALRVGSCRLLREECNGNERATISFDFSVPNRYAAAMDILVVLFVVALMVIESFNLSITIDNMVVKPVEKMLGTVQMMAKILKTVVPSAEQAAGAQSRAQSSRHLKASRTVNDIGDRMYNKAGSSRRFTEDLEDIGGDQENMSEANLLAVVFKKLLYLVAEFYKQGMVELEELDQLDDEGKGVIVEMMMLDHGSHKYEYAMSAPVGSSVQMGKAVTDLPVAEEVIQSMNLDLMAMHHESQLKVMTYIFFDSDVGAITGRRWLELQKFSLFAEHVRQSYLDNPYHNFTHACDVVSTVYRWFRFNRAVDWLDDIDCLALLISAIAHDIAHPGKTTPFLVETGHELAIRYNDKSPLENMHCSKLFEISKKEAFKIFDKFDVPAYKRVRKTCINAIIHTDNALHFDMVKELRECYERVSDICDHQANNVEVYTKMYTEEVLEKHMHLWQQLIVHLCDVGNPMKPWELSVKWARCVQDEFFAQGDEEKRLELPVGMLNDRNKVNRSGAEHGFINFLVAPLTVAATQLFPLMQPLANQMVDNMQSWRDKWVEDSKPPPEEISKKDQDVQKLRDQVEGLSKRKGATIRAIE
jgi:hypothetical protein